MGCTSSTPSTYSANISKEDKSIQFEEDLEETYSEHESTETESENPTETKALPISDSTASVQLVRNNQSTNSLEPGKDLNTNENIKESEQIDLSVATILTQDEENVDILTKLKLEEVVGKFIEITQDTENMVADYVPAEPTEKETEETSTTTETETKEHSKNNAESEVSPSQSQSSRATRWEALADIAAELPPSLAVDPLTGQIYSLSK